MTSASSSCPICDQPTAAAHRPFCSQRCADVDLGRWFAGSYALPAEEPQDEEAIEAVIAAQEEAGLNT